MFQGSLNSEQVLATLLDLPADDSGDYWTQNDNDNDKENVSAGRQESSSKDSDFSLDLSGPSVTVGAPKIGSENSNPEKFPHAVAD